MTVTVTAQGAPVVGGQVVIERSRDGDWVPVADVESGTVDVLELVTHALGTTGGTP